VDERRRSFRTGAGSTTGERYPSSVSVPAKTERAARPRLVAILVPVAIVLLAFAAWWLLARSAPSTELVLYGNVDLRQIELPFNNNERIAEVLVQEGDHVHRGQVLARLDTGRLAPRAKEAEAQVAAQRHVVERLHNGSRPEEIAQARANVDSAEADLDHARSQYARFEDAFAHGAVTRQDKETGETALAAAEARLTVERKSLELALLGPRVEEVQENEARLQALEATLATRRQELADAELRAPLDTVVRTRIQEPGEMSSPQRSAFTLAIVDPKWVRAYVSEPDLGFVHPGMAAWVSIDGFPDRRFDGWVGFVSPVAEFTPKSVQTVELRTSLVYEVRVFVKDPGENLRLGMPATVHLPKGELSPPEPAGTAPVTSLQVSFRAADRGP
jgi:HlyD family secretion protein